MAVLLTVLKVLGILILAVSAFLLILILFVLFVPFRYSFCGGINDPEGSTEVFHLDPKKDISAEGNVRWLLGALCFRGTVGGGDEKAGLICVEARIFGRRISLERLLRRREAGEKKEKEEGKPEEKKSPDKGIEAVLRRLEKLAQRTDDAIHVLQTEYGMRAKQVILMRLLDMFEKALPSEWGLTGVLGLGDPARSARVFAVQGVLYPVTAGHVAVGTEYDLYRYDLRGAARGSVRIITFVYGGVRILFCRDVRRLFRRLRRGPASAHRNGRGSGNKKGSGNGGK